ncbi:MAG: type I restriction endonuclease subunit R [Cyanobacteria bacterium J06592_8]
MTQTVGINKAITNLYEAQQKFGLTPTTDSDFFTEWLEDFPELSLNEKQVCDRLKNRYRYYEADGAITEGTVNFIIVSPLLELLGLCDPPFKIRSEKFVQVEIENGDTILRGLIDVLVVQDQLWLVLIESKRYGFSVMQALPQTLAYLMGSSSQQPVCGLITTGEDFLFVKLDSQQKQYDLSDKFTLSTRRDNQLYTVVQILKRLLGIATPKTA